MALGAAFDHAAAGGASEASHEQRIKESVEKSPCKSMPPHMASEAARAYRGLLPGKFFPKKAYLLEIHVNI